MYDYYFTFRSITAAQRAEAALVRRGLGARLLRSPKFLSIKGCGYALKVRSGAAPAAAAAMAAEGVNYGSIYRVGPDGRGEEILL
jgi:hypothetical protein